MSSEAGTDGSTRAASDDSARWYMQTGGTRHTVRMQPGPGLCPVQAAEGQQRWEAQGDQSRFSLASSQGHTLLAGGWYWLEGWLQLEEGVTAAPSLRVSNSPPIGGTLEVPLPEPDSSGYIGFLVLFPHDVTGLQFSPVQMPARFGMSGFGLARLSGGSALLRMLDLKHGSAPGRIGRCIGFAYTCARDGLSTAVDRAYRRYRQRRLPQGDSYSMWVRRFDTQAPRRAEELVRQGRQLAEAGPLISILLPTYQTPERWLRRCIESVLAQAYPRWQLCIADDASPDPRVMDVLSEYAAADARIELVRRSSNGHISEASNTALAMARGEFVALLDHDDELRAHALLEVVQMIRDAPDAGLVYSDEDKIDAEGRRFDPYFKPDYDPDLLRGQNYICHFTVIRTDLVREVGGFRIGYEGSQDHDLFLRCIERLEPRQVHHVPKILYHWRAIPGSTALERGAKDYASSAGARAVADHLGRTCPSARVAELTHGHFRVLWPLPSPLPKVSLVIPTRDRIDLLRVCIESIVGTSTYPSYEIVVVDNRSTEPETSAYFASLEADRRIRVLRYDAPFNYSAINNWAVGQCDGDIVGLLNNDIEVISPGWMEEMVSQALRPDVGAVGAMLYYPDDSIQHAGVVLGVHGVAAHLYCGMPRGYPGHGGRARVAQQLSAVTAACLFVRRQAYQEVGGLDESFEVAFNDVDFCLRLREAGYRNVWTPFAELYHHESASRGAEDTAEKKQRFAREVEQMLDRWEPVLAADPAYNPNLSLTSLSCEFATPPRH